MNPRLHIITFDIPRILTWHVIALGYEAIKMLKAKKETFLYELDVRN